MGSKFVIAEDNDVSLLFSWAIVVLKWTGVVSSIVLVATYTFYRLSNNEVLLAIKGTELDTLAYAMKNLTISIALIAALSIVLRFLPIAKLKLNIDKLKKKKKIDSDAVWKHSNKRLFSKMYYRNQEGKLIRLSKQEVDIDAVDVIVFMSWIGVFKKRTVFDLK